MKIRRSRGRSFTDNEWAQVIAAAAGLAKNSPVEIAGEFKTGRALFNKNEICFSERRGNGSVVKVFKAYTPVECDAVVEADGEYAALVLAIFCEIERISPAAFVIDMPVEGATEEDIEDARASMFFR